MFICSRGIRKTGREKGRRTWCYTYRSLCRISKIVMHKQRIQVLSFNAYSLSFLLVISIVYADKNLSSVDLASFFYTNSGVWCLSTSKDTSSLTAAAGVFSESVLADTENAIWRFEGLLFCGRKSTRRRNKNRLYGLVCAKTPRIAPEKSELQLWKNRWKRADGGYAVTSDFDGALE